jgi:hypothetical protein
MIVRLTLPAGLTLTEWADRVALDMDPYLSASKLLDETRWQDWAVQFLNSTSIGRNLPNPYGFSDWREWADRFIGSLS